MSLEVLEGRAYKRAPIPLLAIEAEKSRLAARIGRSTGLFYVPEVLGKREETGVLEFEWIPGLRRLIDFALGRDPQMLVLCHRAGVALAAIHQNLLLRPEWNVALPLSDAAIDNGVFLHGDFNASNVCFDSSRNRLVIVDWSAAPLFQGKPTFGCRYFDVLWFGHYLFCSRPAFWQGRWEAGNWYQQMLDGYRCGVGHRFVEADFKRFQQLSSEVFASARRQMAGNLPCLRRLGRRMLLCQAAWRWKRWHSQV